jgi:xanthine dehydrogenase large subunit
VTAFADGYTHVRGESEFVCDLPLPAGTLHAAVRGSQIAHGRLLRVHTDDARDVDGVQGVFTVADIPGENQIGAVIPDEPLLADDTVEFMGQPVALVVADHPATAASAAGLVTVDVEPLPVVLDPREAARSGSLIAGPSVFTSGDVDQAWAQCDVVVHGSTRSGGQEHVYLETQAALAEPREGGRILIHSSTQSPTAVQRAAARVCGLPMHQVEVDTRRLGGAFGGKEDQATQWAVLAALAAQTLRRPVQLVLERHDDMVMTGKRHPYQADFRIGLKRDGRIHAYEVTFYQDAGAHADLSPPVLDRTLFHAANAYAIPNMRATGLSCRTNTAPNTAFRGFGGPQGMYVIEAALAAAAEALGVDRAVIQRANLLRDGDAFHYGQRVENAHGARCWDALDAIVDPGEVARRVAGFNDASAWVKKGHAWMPICFGIAFTNTMLNQASALVHVYTDGSVGVSTAAIEMGQGVNTKIRLIAARTLGIAPHRVMVESTNTTRVANTSATAASSAADLNGQATMLACADVLRRLRAVAAGLLGHDDPDRISVVDGRVHDRAEPTALMWEELVSAAWGARVSLSAQCHYATPGLGFDRTTTKGHPFNYHVYGAALIEVTLDCLRGTYEVDAVHAVHDAGRSLDPVIDRGQAEGALMQGIGWMTLEEVVHGSDGRLLADALANYKVPDVKSTPAVVDFHFLERADNPRGPYSSKAIGEPPLMYGIGAWFALHEAMRAFRPDGRFAWVAPMTPEQVLVQLYDGVGS